MCRAFEELAEKRAKEASEQRTLDIARRMLEDEKFSLEDIIKYTGLLIEEVEALKDSMKEM